MSPLQVQGGLLVLGLAVVGAARAAEPPINPYPRPLVGSQTLHTWGFETGAEGWRPAHDCELEAREGLLRIQCTGNDPYLVAPPCELGAPLAVKLRLRAAAAGGGQIFYATASAGGFAEQRSARFPIQHDGRWHTYEVPLGARDTVTRLRLDPGSGPGRAEVDLIEAVRALRHPLEITKVESSPAEIVAKLKSHAKEPIRFAVRGEWAVVPGGGTREIVVRPGGSAPFVAETIVVEAEGLPPLERTVFVHRPEGETRWLTLRSSTLAVRVAADGSGARIERGGKAVAVLCPILRGGGATKATGSSLEGQEAALAYGDTKAALSLEGDELSVRIESPSACEGPVVRALGGLEQGLFAGIEYLGKGERSSSKKDIETPEHVRFAPEPLKVTMPLMAAATDRGTVAVTWRDMGLQPVYAVPNFFDGTPDHRMALRGRRIAATILVREPQPITEAIAWAVGEMGGLPELPQPPRTVDEQWDLCMRALEGPVKCESGWRHCAGERWPCQPYAAFASTIWRITGRAPKLEKLRGGGSHVRNDAIYFRQGRVQEWLALRRGQARAAIRRQEPDGSWRYRGKFARTHFEDTASGHCARPAATLLEFAWATGDREALEAGVTALEYIKRFRTPRGAQTWEVPLHTPDILASAYLVWAYTRGYELTGEESYLAEARRWALSGVPFTYLWTCKPVMLYATVPVLGATNWQAPNWIGLPVQWCGGVYAYALGLLARHEQSLEWAKLARGILICAEQQQYPGGKFVGCLPDSFDLASQSRRPWNINPCALVSLRLLLDGRVDSLAVAADGGHRVAAPFPVRIRDGQAHIQAEAGLRYQILIDGERIVGVESKGGDVVPLD
ncbi:MAG: hypothetical protein ACLF0G_11200 [Candidatus Brocadiia bacterium]